VLLYVHLVNGLYTQTFHAVVHHPRECTEL